MLIFDTSSFIELFKFYPKRFPSLWKEFGKMVDSGRILSVREALREIEEKDGPLAEWAALHKVLFAPPSFAEAKIVQDIFKIAHFQQSLERKKQLKGGAFADPFLIAKAKTSGGTVVTEERRKPKAAKIPNICDHFQVDCINLELFMERQGWQF